MKYEYDDGGRKQAGFKGSTRDCVVRSIAIISGKPYKEVYDEINALQDKRSNARTGVRKATYKKYLASLGFKWTPTMTIGSGCKVHLKSDELPAGRIIVSVSKHLVAVINGVIHDTYDCSRNETRCVYGYWQQESK